MSPNPEKMRGYWGERRVGVSPGQEGRRMGREGRGESRGWWSLPGRAGGGMRTGTCSVVLEIGGEEQSQFFPGCQ